LIDSLYGPGGRVSKRIRRAAASLALIMAIALCLRLLHAWEYQRERPRPALGVFPFLFEPGNVGVALAKGHGFSSPFREDTGPTAWLTPVYPLILAGIFRIFGVYTLASFAAAAGLNILFSTLTILPLYHAARRVGGTGVAALAAWLWAVFPNAIKLPVESIWEASLAALLAAAILWATLALADSQKIRSWCAYGLLWGLALMTSPALGSLLPLLLGWLAWRARPRLGRPLVAVAIALLCCLPWTIRNFETFHAFIPLRSVFGLTLRLGNQDQAADPFFGRMHPIYNSAQRARYAELGEVAYMREKKQEALQFIAEHPGAEARAIWSHFVALWTGGTARPLEDFLHSRSWSFRGVLLFNLLAAAGALCGVAMLLAPRHPYAFPVAVFPAVFPLVYYLSQGSARYRHPIDPVLMLLLAVALWSARTRSIKTQPHQVPPRH